MRGNGRGTSPFRTIATVIGLALAPGTAGAAEPPLVGCYERSYDAVHLAAHKGQLPVRVTISIAARDPREQINGFVADGFLKVWLRGKDLSFDSGGACRVRGNDLACVGSVSAAETAVCTSRQDGLHDCRTNSSDAGGFSVEGRPDGVLVSIPDRLELHQRLHIGGPFLNLSSSNVEHRAFLLKKIPCQEGGWITDPTNGCRVWSAHPQAGEAVSWSGKCPNGTAMGPGVLQQLKDGKPNGRYEGVYYEGKREDRSVFTWPNGERYEGQWREDKREGRGVYTWPNGDRFEGEWHDDKREGPGVLTFANGDRFEGWYIEDLRDGSGVFTWANGERFEGWYGDDKPNGAGTLTRSSGDTFTGNWTNGCFRQGGRTAWIDTTEAACGFK